MGDFYELFYEDAVNAAQILEISLTSRNKNADNPIPMAGVPYHSAQQYIDVLIEQGYKVAIAEQMEDPKQAVGVVKREVVQVITPGTVVDSSKPDSQNNFLVAIDRDGNQFWPSLYGPGDRRLLCDRSFGFHAGLWGNPQSQGSRSGAGL